MRKIFLLSFLSIGFFAQAQSDSIARQEIMQSRPLPRSNDHLLVQLGYATWVDMPDSINTGGIPRTFNMYLMMDFPFKTSPRWSAAIGAGLATDHIFFEKTGVTIHEGPAARFTNRQDTTFFKKNKIATAFLEAPVELRFSSNPDDDARSIKFALGFKAGLLLSAHTKGKTLRNNSGDINDYKEKIYSKRFFNNNRFSGMFRVGYGHFTLFTSYQLNPLFKEGLGPQVHPMSIGLTLSGL